MLNLLKKYWRYVAVCFCVIVLIITGCIYHLSYNKVEIEKQSVKSTKLENKNSNKNSKTVFVDVKGAVNAPGVYELDSDKRVVDAISIAGGLNSKADTINLNLSKKLTDEMTIIVYTKTEIYNFKKDNGNKEVSCASFECVCPDSSNSACLNTNTSSTDNKSSNGKVSLNNGTKEELMTLSGIGESKADAIIKYRQNNGNFNSIEDIKNVSGIGDAMFNKIKDNITI